MALKLVSGAGCAQAIVMQASRIANVGNNLFIGKNRSYMYYVTWRLNFLSAATVVPITADGEIRKSGYD
jgi:hypothetical protein